MKTKGARSITDEQIIAALRKEHGLITYAAPCYLKGAEV